MVLGRSTACRPRIRSRPLVPAFCHLPCLISKDPPPLDLGQVVDARRLPEQVSVPLQQRSGIGRGDVTKDRSSAARQGLPSETPVSNDTVDRKTDLAPDPCAAFDRAVWG